jgi:hypothetical protein
MITIENRGGELSGKSVLTQDPLALLHADQVNA